LRKESIVSGHTAEEAAGKVKAGVGFEITEPQPTHSILSGKACICVYSSAEDMGMASAVSMAARQCRLVEEQGETSMMLMAAPSAFPFYEAYVRLAHSSQALQEAIHRTHFFQFDDYPVPLHHPASFRGLLCKHFFFKLEEYCDPARVHLFDADSPDIEEACRRYGELILEHGPDLQLKGTGENGHWGFHEPDIPVTGEPRFVRVTLSEENVAQQMRDHPRIFTDAADVPREAFTANVPLFMRTRHLIEDNVPQPSKAFALLAAYGSDVADACVPSSVLKTHHSAMVRTTEASAWALLEYGQRGEVSADTLRILAESIRRKDSKERDQPDIRMREVLKQMRIVCK